MTATISSTANEIATIEAEAAQLAERNARAQQRLAKLRADQERRRQDRLRAWAAKTLASFDADRAEAERAVAAAAASFQASVAAGDLVAALPRYQDWLRADATRLATVERFNRALTYRPVGEVRKEVINQREIVPDLVAALATASYASHLAVIGEATDETMAEFRRLLDGGEGEG